jgi:hypothetical protein
MLAALAFPNEDSENVVSDLELGHTFTDTLYNSTDRRCQIIRCHYYKQFAKAAA